MQFNFLEDATDDAESESPGESPNYTLCGFAAEHLVAADLMFAGLNCSLSSSMSRFDLIVDVGSAVRRVQVKASMWPKKRGSYLPGYVFGDGKDGSLRDYAGEVDVFAFVAVDIRRVLYAKIEDVKRRAVISADSFTKEACDLSRQLALRST